MRLYRFNNISDLRLFRPDARVLRAQLTRVLAFQVQSLSRQSDEQRLHFRGPPRTARMSTGGVRHRIASRAIPSGSEQDMPEHDLRPPQ